MQKIETSMLLRQLLSMVHLKALVIYFGNMKAYFINYPKVFKLLDWWAQFKVSYDYPQTWPLLLTLKEILLCLITSKRKKGVSCRWLNPWVDFRGFGMLLCECHQLQLQSAFWFLQQCLFYFLQMPILERTGIWII